MPGPAFLRGETVALHVVEENDLEFLYDLVNDPRVWSTLHQVHPQTMADEREFYDRIVEDDGETHLLVCREGTPVGVVGLNGVDTEWGVAELGYYVDPEAQGQGYATEAVGLLADYAFDQRRLAKLAADSLASNGASRRVLEKNGFVEEGRFREQAFVDGERVDVVRYGLLPGDR